MEIKHAIITPFMGRLRDRFCVYHEEKTPLERIEAVARVRGAHGVEIIYPYECDDLDGVKKILRDHGLGVAAVNVNIKAEPEFVNGSASAPSRAVRNRAIRFIRDGMDAAAALGADKVTCCPLSDGYDYLFQADYREAWQNMVSTFKEAAVHRRDIRLYLEYKGSEPRVQCFLDTAAKSVCMIRDINESNLGITIDVGHALLAGETPAESLCLVKNSGIPYYIHTNDNNRKWDWDLISGTRNLWDFIELFFYLKEFDYRGWVTSDMCPMRVDPVEAFERNIAFTEKIMEMVNRMDSETILSMMKSDSSLAILKLLETNVLQ